jgi:hypothetical protein
VFSCAELAGGFSLQGVSTGDRFARTVDLLITNKKRRAQYSENSVVISESGGIDGYRLPSIALELLHFCYTDSGGKIWGAVEYQPATRASRAALTMAADDWRALIPVLHRPNLLQQE